MTEDYHDRLDQIHRCVNALGGHETDDYDRGANDMVCDALVIIGWFGGMDPGVIPPMSAWWPRAPTKHARPSSMNTGAITVMSGK